MRLARSVLFGAVFLALFVAAAPPYDFRKSPAYGALAEAEREKLDRVDRDFTLLWGALDRYADDHNDAIPQALDELVPLYLKELPQDPFTPADKSANYRYQRGAPGNRAWIVSSVGLPDFPYLAERGNFSLYRCKGVWISGINPVRIPSETEQPATRP